MPLNENDFLALTARVAELERRFDELKKAHDTAVQALGTRTGELEIWQGTATATLATHGQDIAARVKAVDYNAAERLAQQGRQEANNKIAGIEAALTSRNEDALLLANMSLLYGLMAREWRIARDRVVKVTSSPTTLQSLSRTGTVVLVALLSAAAGAGASIAGSLLAHAIDGPLVALAGKLGFDESKAAEAMEKDGGEALKDGVTTGLTGLLSFAGHSTKGALPEVTDPLEFFLDLETQLREFALEVAHTQKSTDPWSRTAVKNPLVNAPPSGNAKTKLQGFAKDQHLDDMKADAFWRFLFESPDPATVYVGKGHKERWAIVQSVVAAAMRRLAWSLYCRSQWRNLTWDYTVKVDRACSFDDGSGLGVNAWKQDPVAEWPYKAWAHNMGWPAHFISNIVPDFAGFEHDPDHGYYAIDAAGQADARKLRKRQAHFSLAVYMCCQVRPERGMDAADPMRGDAEGWLKQYLREGKTDKNEKTFAQYRAMRDEVNIAEIRFGEGRFGSATGKKGRMTSANSEGDPYRLGINPKIITVIIAATARLSRNAKLELAGPKQPNGDWPLVKGSEENLWLTKGGTHSWTRLALTSGEVYRVSLLDRKQTRERGDASHNTEGFFFRVG